MLVEGAMRHAGGHVRADYVRLRRCGISAADAVFLAKLGHDLRSMYTDVLTAPVPDNLATLADRFRERRPAGPVRDVRAAG